MFQDRSLHEHGPSHMSSSDSTRPSSSCCRRQGIKRLLAIPPYLHLVAIPILGFLAATAAHAPAPSHSLAIVALCLAAVGIKVHGSRKPTTTTAVATNTNMNVHISHFASSTCEHARPPPRSRLVLSLVFATAYAFTADFTAATLLWSAPKDKSQPWFLGFNGWLLFGLGAALWLLAAALWVLEPLSWVVLWREERRGQGGVSLRLESERYFPGSPQGASEEEDGESTIIVWEEDSEDDRNRVSMESQTKD